MFGEGRTRLQARRASPSCCSCGAELLGNEGRQVVVVERLRETSGRFVGVARLIRSAERLVETGARDGAADRLASAGARRKLAESEGLLGLVQFFVARR